MKKDWKFSFIVINFINLLLYLFLLLCLCPALKYLGSATLVLYLFLSRSLTSPTLTIHNPHITFNRFHSPFLDFINLLLYNNFSIINSIIIIYHCSLIFGNNNEKKDDFQIFMDKITKSSSKYVLDINTNRTKFIVISKEDITGVHASIIILE